MAKAPAKQLDLEIDEMPPKLADLIEDTTNDRFVDVASLMANYDQRRLHGWPVQSPSEWLEVDGVVYIATVEGHSGAPRLVRMTVDELLDRHG